jgi:CheY-like chemotaxis protein
MAPPNERDHTIVHIVDDDASFLTAISRLLRANGFAVRTYLSAHEFLGQRDADTPGYVLADLQMPQMNSLDLQIALAPGPDLGQSLKVNYCNGAYVTFGGNFRNVSVAWQYSWLC